MDGINPATGEITSHGIGKLALALAAAQGEIQGAAKDSENPAFKRGEGASAIVSKYADLEAVWAACRAPLSKNKLAVLQTTHKLGDDWVLRTTLAHESGESMYGDFPVKPIKPDMQGFMAAVTYARRGGLAAIVGVAPRGEDDDGNTATGVKINGPMPGPTKDKSAPVQVLKRPEAVTPEVIAWCNEAIAKLDVMPSAKAVNDWEAANEDHMKRLKAKSMEQWNRVTGFLLEKLEALGALDNGERKANGR